MQLREEWEVPILLWPPLEELVPVDLEPEVKILLRLWRIVSKILLPQRQKADSAEEVDGTAEVKVNEETFEVTLFLEEISN